MVYFTQTWLRVTLVVFAFWPALGLGQNASCLQSTAYYAEFYQGLYTMHRHGLDTFATDSSDRQLYFFQVQRNGDKVEANVVKSVQANNACRPATKTNSFNCTMLLDNAFATWLPPTPKMHNPKTGLGFCRHYKKCVSE